MRFDIHAGPLIEVLDWTPTGQLWPVTYEFTNNASGAPSTGHGRTRVHVSTRLTVVPLKWSSSPGTE